MNKIGNIIESGTIKLLIAAFALGGIYGEFRSVEKDLVIIERRLDKKIEKLNRVEKRVRNLEACKH